MRAACAIALAVIGLLLALGRGGQAGPGPVYVVPIEGEIDLGVAPYVARALEEAERAGAAAVILDIDTLGGRLDAAVTIRDALLETELRTIAFVDRRAISAGALIALAAQEIAMADGATIGAAAPVVAGPAGEAQPGGEKAVSYVRKELRATAEARGRPADLAEAMGDADVEVPGVVARGKLLTLTTEEALALDVADLRAADLDALLADLGLAESEVRHVAPSWAETLVRFLTGPIVSSLLLALGTLGVLVELRAPGFGAPGIVGILSLALFFWAHWLVRLVGWEEIALVGLGVALIAVEVFATPGFGLPGILGSLALLAGLTLSLVGAGVTVEAAALALGRVALTVAIALGGALALLRVLPRLPFGRSLVLGTGLGQQAPPGVPPEALRAGDRGVAATPLRPAGIAHFASATREGEAEAASGARVDVVSDGDYIDPGEPIEVARVEGNRIVVRRAQPG